jgi:hypothetical protein
MSNLALFVVGALVTLLVAASMVLLFWGAILDGHDQHEHQRAEEEAAEHRSRDQALHGVDAAYTAPAPVVRAAIDLPPPRAAVGTDR